jgi:hypothetical protein
LKTNSFILILTACVTLAIISPAFADVNVQYVDTMPPTQIPEITYWFWHSNTLANAHYLSDIQNMATNSAYTFTFLTEREGVDFYDYKKMHDIFAQLVREAHQHNIRVGLQLWEYWSGVHANNLTGEDSRQPLPLDQAQALVTEGKVVLDANGHADYSAPKAVRTSLRISRTTCR